MTDETRAQVERLRADAQPVGQPLTRSAVFVTCTFAADPSATPAIAEAVAGVDDLVKTVALRELDGHVSCVVGLGPAAWARLAPEAGAPVELHDFVPLAGPRHDAPSTGGDLFLHIRAERDDLCFELERLLLASFGDLVTVTDEVIGFRYFDARDLLGFVDGTANPLGPDIADAALIGPDDPAFAGGSYLVVQKYLHDLDAWSALPAGEQERVIGRTKLDNIELDDSTWERKPHKTLANVQDADGTELDIVRDNMPFGRPGRGEFGTYFIGYSGRLWVTEEMLRKMFLGDPPGGYDRILDFSTAVTGAVFYVPRRGQLQSLGVATDATDPPAAPDPPAVPDRSDGSLHIGSLKPATTDRQP